MTVRRRNILWLMTDEQRADSMGYEGHPWAHTPNLDRVARAGVRFASAYTPSPVCVSARACMLTGRAGSSIGMLNNHHILDPDDPGFLTWRFAAAGYQVASFGKHHYQCARRAFDVEAGSSLGERVHPFYYKVPVDAEAAGVVRYSGPFPWLFAGRFPGEVADTPEMRNVDLALDWVRRRDPGRPFFLRLSFLAPHTPVVTPAPFDTLVDPDCIDLPIDRLEVGQFATATHREHLGDIAGTRRMTDEEIRRARQCYYGYVACVDNVFGQLLDELRNMGELDNTIIVYVSDHGTHLGDHGFFQKQSFWEASVRVPMFFSGPGIQKREEAVTSPVNAGSLLPTLLDLVGLPAAAGLGVPELVEFPSVASTLRGDAVDELSPVFSEIDFGVWCYRDGDRYVMIRDGDWKLALYRDPGGRGQRAGAEDRMLFNLADDPGECCNLAADPACASVVASLVDKIDTWDHSRQLKAPTVDKTKQSRRAS